MTSRTPVGFSNHLGRVRLGSIRNNNSWNNASERSFESHSHSGILGFHSRYSALGSTIAGIYILISDLSQTNAVEVLSCSQPPLHSSRLTRDLSGLIRDLSGLIRDLSGLTRDLPGLIRDLSGLTRTCRVICVFKPQVNVLTLLYKKS